MRRIRSAYLGFAVVSLLAYPFASVTGKDAIYLLSAASLIAALWWGLRTYRPAQRSPLLLLMAGFACFLIGDATSVVLDQIVGAAKPFPSIADVAYLLFYPLVYIAIGRFLALLLLPRLDHEPPCPLPQRSTATSSSLAGNPPLRGLTPSTRPRTVHAVCAGSLPNRHFACAQRVGLLRTGRKEISLTCGVYDR